MSIQCLAKWEIRYPLVKEKTPVNLFNCLWGCPLHAWNEKSISSSAKTFQIIISAKKGKMINATRYCKTRKKKLKGLLRINGEARWQWESTRYTPISDLTQPTSKSSFLARLDGTFWTTHRILLTLFTSVIMHLGGKRFSTRNQGTYKTEWRSC